MTCVIIVRIVINVRVKRAEYVVKSGKGSTNKKTRITHVLIAAIRKDDSNHNVKKMMRMIKQSNASLAIIAYESACHAISSLLSQVM